jgi:hypothetical protein
VVPVNSSLLTIILYSEQHSFITALNIQSLSWCYNWVRLCIITFFAQNAYSYYMTVWFSLPISVSFHHIPCFEFSNAALWYKFLGKFSFVLYQSNVSQGSSVGTVTVLWQDCQGTRVWFLEGTKIVLFSRDCLWGTPKFYAISPRGSVVGSKRQLCEVVGSCGSVIEVKNALFPTSTSS